MSITQQGIHSIIGGDQIIMFTNPATVKSIQGYQDKASMSSWYQENPEKAHLGLMNFWGQQTQTTYPIYRELLQNRAMLEVNGFDGTFTYDIPIEDYEGCYTTRDTSFQHNAGVDGGEFTIMLSEEYTAGDVLTYDAEFGQQIIVTESTPVNQLSDGFEHTVKLVTNDKTEWYMSSNLVKGKTYFKINHAVGGEYGTRFSHVQFPNSFGSMRAQFQLGSLRGVEAYVTGYADKKNLGGAVASAKEYYTKLIDEATQLGEIAIIADKVVDAGGKARPNMATARIGATMQYLVHRELDKLTAYALLFQKAGTVRDGNGDYRLNEGLWHQLRRGKRVLYGRPGGITRQHLQEAVEYVFRNNPYKPVIERRVKFKGGRLAVANVLEIFADEIRNQASLLAATGFVGTDRQLPQSPVQGKDLMNLKYSPVRFIEAYIPNVGWLEIEEDPSLNMNPMADRFAIGMHPEQLAHTAYSLVIWDVADRQYSNNSELPKGAKLIQGGDSNANIFLVKPEGEMTYWGTSNGRYDITKAAGIVSSHKQIGQEFWAYNSMAIWVKDVTKFVMIELDPDARKGFN